MMPCLCVLAEPTLCSKGQLDETVRNKLKETVKAGH